MKRTPEEIKLATNKRKCLVCGKEFIFIKYNSHVKNGHKGIFCSNICRITYKKQNSFHFDCIICGNVVYTQPAQMKYRNRKTCSRDCRWKYMRAITERRRKELGYTKHQLDRLARNSPEASKWRMAVFERDDYTCQICGIRGTYLEADHIKPFAYFPELRFELSNGRTLCRPCHDKTKMSAKKMKEIYEKK